MRGELRRTTLCGGTPSAVAMNGRKNSELARVRSAGTASRRPSRRPIALIGIPCQMSTTVWRGLSRPPPWTGWVNTTDLERRYCQAAAADPRRRTRARAPRDSRTRVATAFVGSVSRTTTRPSTSRQASSSGGSAASVSG